MADQTEFSPALLRYVRQVSLRDDDVLAELRADTLELPMGPAMQVMPEEGQLLGLLVGLTRARTVVEVGTFTGYSALCMARALPAGGRIITCDLNAKWIRFATPYWQRAGIAERVDARVGDAATTLAALRDELGPQAVDLVFIDADKVNYRTYYEYALDLLRPGGLIVADNTVLFGRVIDPARQEPETAAVREFNTLVRDDDRVTVSLLPMADGITLAVKRAA